MQTVTQRPNTHVFYDINWGWWLKNHGYANNDVISVSWSSSNGTANITTSTFTGGRSRVWVTGLQYKKSVTITGKISLPPPPGSNTNVSDTFSFQILCNDT